MSVGTHYGHLQLQTRPPPPVFTSSREIFTMGTGPRAMCALIGDMFVGKTSLAQSFISGTFSEKVTTSIGGSFMARTLKDPPLTVQIWDTAGFERFRSMLPHYVRDACCLMFVFDLSSRKTFLSMRDYWVDFAAENAPRENLVRVLVGNKQDKTDERQVDEIDAKSFADHYGMLYFETSAKTFHNVNQMFVKTAIKMVQVGAYEPGTSGNIVLTPDSAKDKKCCLTT